MFVNIAPAVLDATAPADAQVAAAGNGRGTPPTNQQIIDKAKAAYAEYRPAVDAMTLALVNTVKDADMADALVRLDATNWSSPGISVSIVEPFFSSNEIAEAVNVVRRTTSLSTLSVGAFSSSLPQDVSGPGMIGWAAEPPAAARTGLILDLDIFKSIVTVDNTTNLQYGLWLGAPDTLHDRVIGFYANTTIQGVGVNLKILLTQTLQPYGFVSSTGATVPVNVGVFAGATSQWRGA